MSRFLVGVARSTFRVLAGVLLFLGQRSPLVGCGGFRTVVFSLPQERSNGRVAVCDEVQHASCAFVGVLLFLGQRSPLVGCGGFRTVVRTIGTVGLRFATRSNSGLRVRVGVLLFLGQRSPLVGCGGFRTVVFSLPQERSNGRVAVCDEVQHASCAFVGVLLFLGQRSPLVGCGGFRTVVFSLSQERSNGRVAVCDEVQHASCAFVGVPLFLGQRSPLVGCGGFRTVVFSLSQERSNGRVAVCDECCRRRLRARPSFLSLGRCACLERVRLSRPRSSHRLFSWECVWRACSVSTVVSPALDAEISSMRSHATVLRRQKSVLDRLCLAL